MLTMDERRKIANYLNDRGCPNCKKDCPICRINLEDIYFHPVDDADGKCCKCNFSYRLLLNRIEKNNSTNSVTNLVWD